MSSLFERLIESKKKIAPIRAIFGIHVLSFFLISYMITLIGLNYSRSLCTSSHNKSQVFAYQFAFNFSLFFGAFLHAVFIRKIMSMKLIAMTSFLSLFFLNFVIVNVVDFKLVFINLSFFGFCLGVGYSSIANSFIFVFQSVNNNILIQVFHCISTIGSITSIIIYQSTPIQHRAPCTLDESDAHFLSLLPQIPSLEVFSLNPSISLKFIHYSLSFLLIMLTGFICQLDFNHTSTRISIRREAEHVESLTQQSDVNSFKLMLLCCLVAFIANLMSTMFPFLIMLQPNPNFLLYQVFLISFMWARMMATLVSDHISSYFLIGLSIFGCGIGCCLIASEPFVVAGTVCFGFSLSFIHPALLVYINRDLSLKASYNFYLTCSHFFAYAVFPFVLTFVSTRLFIAFNLIAIILLVIILVTILSFQAQIERMNATQSGLNLFVSRFLTGESLLKRTRSIRPFISRLRPNSYRRFANRRGVRTPSPAPPPADISPSDAAIDDIPMEVHESTKFLTPTLV